MMIKKRMHALWNPSLYHGWGRRKRFFEGWYYKVVSADEQNAFAFIPGIAMDTNGKQQAFIQVLDGKELTAAYHKYTADQFFPRSNMHDVLVGNSRFTYKKIELELPNITGTLEFENQNEWPSSWYSPGIMGPFSFIPFMQCYHGILSMDHKINGSLEVNGVNIDFTGGRGYMEKDWGNSFPEGYIWMQSNHFSKVGVSVKTSIAKIPWMGSRFIGFIAGVQLEDRLIQFTTYNFTKLRQCEVTEKQVTIVLENTSYKLEIVADREKSTSLAAPIAGFMDARIEESMDARINAILTEKKTGKVLLNDVGTSAGLEVAGDYESLLKT